MVDELHPDCLHPNCDDNFIRDEGDKCSDHRRQAHLEFLAMFPDGESGIVLQWELNGAYTDLGPFVFRVFRSNTPQGPFEEIASLTDQFIYKDVAALLTGFNKDIYYKVTMEPGSLVTPVTNGFTPMRTQEFLIRKKIFRDECCLLKSCNGVNVIVLKRKRWGPRCDNCWDYKTGRCIIQNCEMCYGVGFVGGYNSMGVTLGHIKPAIIGTDYNSPTSIPEMQSANAMLQPYPLVIRGDIIVEVDTNKRWEVVSGQNTELLRNPVHQDFTVSRMNQPHIIYKFPVEGINA